LSKSNNRSTSKKETLIRSDSFFQTKYQCLKKRVVIVHDLVLLFEVIAFAINSLLVGLFLEVLLFATRVVVAWIVSIATIVLAFVVIASFVLMVVAVLATMMPVVRTMAARYRKMSCFLFLRLPLLLELVKDTGCFVSSLALHENGHEPKRVCGHRFVCFRKLKLMRLWLREKDLFAFAP
jgi:hypothetical protein